MKGHKQVHRRPRAAGGRNGPGAQASALKARGQLVAATANWTWDLGTPVIYRYIHMYIYIYMGMVSSRDTAFYYIIYSMHTPVTEGTTFPSMSYRDNVIIRNNI